MGKGTWFVIPGKQDGERTLEEQMRGLEPALAEAKGKTVWDLGCAEGLISLAFLRAGAARVEGCDFNEVLLEVAQDLLKQLPREVRKRIAFRQADLRRTLGHGLTASFDIVLALAVVHKLSEPEKALGYVARAARSLVVIRLPGGSQGRFKSKGYQAPCDVNEAMPGHGFVLERCLPGPRDELVQYWRRR